MRIDAQQFHPPSNSSSVPGDWTWRRLDSVCQGIFDCPHSTPALTGNGPYIARSQDVRSGMFRIEEAARVSEETYRERTARAEPRPGDLLYSREGTYFGIAADIPRGVRVCLGQRMVLLRPDAATIESRFLRYWLNSAAMASHIQGFRDGSVAERLNLPTIRALPVAVPPIREQQAIAHILGALDDKIELNRRMNETLEAMARALFKSWFLDFDPVRAKIERRDHQLPERIADLFPNGFEDSELGKVPTGWCVGCIDDEFELMMGQSPPGDTYNVNGAGAPFYQGRADFGTRFPRRRVYCSNPTRVAKTGDTLISVRAPVGDINVALEDCSIGRGVAAARHKTGSRSYSYQFMRSLREVFALFEATGTVFGSISRKDFHAIRCVVPPRNVVLGFEAMITPLDSQIEVNERRSHTLAAVRDSLLPKLVSGEIRIKDAERIVANV